MAYWQKSWQEEVRNNQSFLRRDADSGYEYQPFSNDE